MIEKIIAENLGIDQNSIKDTSNFVNDLGADSLNIVEVVMAIENCKMVRSFQLMWVA